MGFLPVESTQLVGVGRETSDRSDRASLTSQGITDYRGLRADALLEHAANTVPDRIALISGDQTWTYRQLQTRVDQAAAMLVRLGVQPGDRVGILLPNIAEYVISANAIWRCGAVSVAISPLMVTEEIDRLVEQTDCRWVVCLDVLAASVTSPQTSLLIVSIRGQLSSLEQMGYLWMRWQRLGRLTVATGPRERWFWDEMNQTVIAERNNPLVEFDPTITPAHLLPTGGTTGTSKIVTLSHTNLVANAWQQYQWTGARFAGDTMLGVLPFFHSYGMSATIMAASAMGATVVMHHRYHTRKTIELLQTHQPTVFHAVPAMLVAMNDAFRKRTPQIKSLRWVISGGEALEPEVAAEFADHTGALVVEGYGLSEASPVTHVGNLFAAPQYGTIGFPLPDTQCRIVDTRDRQSQVMAGEVGELLIRGPQVMLGYWEDDEAVGDVDRRSDPIVDGWLHTGDLAIKQIDGAYRIVGRMKDLIITSGFNVHPIEVEKVLRDIPEVADAAVVGVADPRHGEIVKAFIVLEPKASWSQAAAEAHCKQHLSKYKRPRQFEIVRGDLPRNFLGKVVRRHLRESEARS